VSCRSDAFLGREKRGDIWLEPKSELTVFKMCALVATDSKHILSDGGQFMESTHRRFVKGGANRNGCEETSRGRSRGKQVGEGRKRFPKDEWVVKETNGGR